jgi:hypothetical protein
MKGITNKLVGTIGQNGANSHNDKDAEPARGPQKQEMLLFNEVFPKNRVHILYSDGNSENLLLSREIARNPLIKRPAFIIREDYLEGARYEFYTKSVGEKVLLYSVGDRILTGMKMINIKGYEDMEEIFMYCNIFGYRKADVVSNQIYSRMALRNCPEKPDEIAVITGIVEMALEAGADFICVDSIYDIFCGKTSLDRQGIERIIRPLAEKSATLLFIQNSNSCGKLFDSVDLAKTVDNVYRLYRETKYHDIDARAETFVLDEEAARHNSRQRVVLWREFTEIGVHYSLFDVEPFKERAASLRRPPNVWARVRAELRHISDDTVSFEDLHERIGGKASVTRGALKHILKVFAKQGKIRKADDRTWNVITILR